MTDMSREPLAADLFVPDAKLPTNLAIATTLILAIAGLLSTTFYV